MHWLVYYGDQLPSKVLKNLDYAILDPDSISPQKLSKSSTKFIGYVSVGEAETYRSYWSQVEGQEFIIEKNPDWEGNYLIDIRSEEWQKILLQQVVPGILQKGYQGIFLDTIDTATYLENKDPQKFKGSKQAMIEFVKKLRKQFSQIIILPNNGLEILHEYGEVVNGVVVEDLYTHYDFKTKKSTATSYEVSQYKEKYLDEFKKRFKKPVFNILYDESDATPLVQTAIKSSKQKGYEWYVTTVDLMKIGTVAH